jgi:alpha-amylase/alpha-mannosidase (GH57 family)
MAILAVNLFDPNKMKDLKFVCIHGHFYQPPRENAWLEVVEMQDSASPFHDWNERINFECYAPNTAARLLDEQQMIIGISNNYSRISFNFGPTLLSWMEKADPATYQAILQADKDSLVYFKGHGSAMAQVYSHLIMPLAPRRDKETQVRWGIHDFATRFGRKPEGMWLAETAADTESLEVLAENGIKFTVLAPRQGKAIRKIGSSDWEELAHDSIDPRRAYLCKLPSGKEISLFFYDGNIAQGVAFKGLLNDGRSFADAFINAFEDIPDPQLIHIATDGESYGHHHRYGEMALSACLDNIQNHEDIKLTNYSQFLELFPPTWEVQIHENSSWSCVHGVERWRSNCGCNSGGRSDWNQEWRGPLRDALDWLRDELVPLYLKHTKALLYDPWAARNGYITAFMDRSDASIEQFIERYARKTLLEDEKITLLRMMEMQRHAMLMYTSCGWFFDEVSGLETDQILQYANRAIHYAEQISGFDFHDEFVRRLEKVPSNYFPNGATSYRKNVIPARLDLARVGMHFAASSLFEEYPEDLEIFNYWAKSEVFDRYEAGKLKIVIGRTTVRSKATHSEKLFNFAVLYLGQQNLIGHISVDMSRERYAEMAEEIIPAFNNTDLGQVVGIMQDYFGSDRFTYWHLFRDEKRKILGEIMGRSLLQAETVFREIFNDNYQLMIGIQSSNIPLPDTFTSAVKFILNNDFYGVFTNGHSLNNRELQHLSDEFEKWDVKLTNRSSLKLVVAERLYQEIQKVEQEGPIAVDRLHHLNRTLEILQKMPIELNIWKTQNLYYSLLLTLPKTNFPVQWHANWQRLGELLNVKVRSMIFEISK